MNKKYFKDKYRNVKLNNQKIMNFIYIFYNLFFYFFILNYKLFIFFFFFENIKLTN